MADFCLISRRSLDDADYRIFRYHYLLGADWKLCTRQLKLDRGLFFHMIYRIQTRTGRALAELEPYPLFPVDDYFAISEQPAPRKTIQFKKQLKRVLRPPGFRLPLSA